jgi:hypothetical protein
MLTEIMWTCLPNGIATAGASPTLKLSLVVTPRLKGATASDTIAGTVFENWPAYVKEISQHGDWTVSFFSTTSTGKVVNDWIRPTSAFNVDGSFVWQSIFPASTPVVDAQANADASHLSIHSFDAGKIATALRDAHRYATESHARHGRLKLTGTDPYSTLLAERKRAKKLLPKMAAALRGHTRGPAHHVLRQAYHAETGDTGLGYELMRHALFYDHDKHRERLRAERASWNGKRVAAGTTPSTAMASDFNSLVAHMGGQPQLQRKLGLIIDLVVPVPSGLTIGRDGTVPTPVTIFMNMPPASKYTDAYPAAMLSTVSYIEPKSHADITPSLFRASVSGLPTTTSGGAINNGFLPLGDQNQYTLYSEDTEGGPIKIDVTSTGATEQTPTGVDVAAPFPALRTAGIAISQAKRDTVLDGQINNQTNFQNTYWKTGSGVLPLFAEDMVRGFAVDVAIRDAQNPSAPLVFQSLCKRDTRMFFPALASLAALPAGTPASFVLSDEGYVKASSPNAPGDGNEIDLHSALIGWEGWSLGAQRPGRAITAATPAGDTVQTETPLQPINAPDQNFPSCQLTVRASAGSLPRLRFGQTYVFRVRLIDLAGNDMSVHSASLVTPNITTTSADTGQPISVSPNVSPAISYLRYEPVPNPVTVLQAPLTEGEHVDNLVIRSNPWGFTPQNAAQYAAWSATQPKLKPMNPYAATSARWVAPPKGAWNQAEQMGAFDPGYFNPISTAVATDIQSGAITPGQPYANAGFLARKSALFQCSQKEAGLFTHTRVWDTSNLGATSPSATNPVQIFTPPGAQNLPPPVNPGQPLGTGQYNLLLNNGSPVTLPYLPDANAQGIHLQQLDASDNPITSAVAARTFAPRAGCAWPEIDMPQFVLQDGGLDAPAPSLVGGVTGIAGLDGSAPASNTPIVFSLAPGQQISLHYGSVVQDVTKMASSELDTSGVVHPIPTHAPSNKMMLVHAVQQPKPPSAMKIGFTPRNPGDTAVTLTGNFAVHGLTSNNVDLNAAWVEPVDVELSSDDTVVEALDGTHRRLSMTRGRVQTWTLDPSDSVIQLSAPQGEPAIPALVQQFGDTKTRLVTYQATATSRFREYFPQSLQTDSANFQNSCPAGVLTQGTLLSSGTRIPSTARPIAPKILYVVPTYAWALPTSKTDRQGNNVTTSVRTGRGLRVFVDRPWYTTGDTEQLAVLIAPAGSAATDPAIAPNVSQWGYDPTRYPQADKLGVLDQSQVLGGAIVTGVPLPDKSAKVTVVAFNPSAFDPVRNLWYFDIEFNASVVEAPFVRLALARFQPNSLGGPGFSYPPDATLDLRMSTVVLADMIKLSADRTGTYTLNKADSSVNVALQGPVYADAKWTGTSGPLALNTRNDGAAEGRMVYAQVLETTAANPGEFDWYPVGSPVNLPPFQSAGALGTSTNLSFIGTIPKPTGLAAGSKHKLLISEYEVFATDASVAFPGTATIKNYPSGSMPLPSAPAGSGTTSRVVFTDYLPLPY